MVLLLCFLLLLQILLLAVQFQEQLADKGIDRKLRLSLIVAGLLLPAMLTVILFIVVQEFKL
jgi:hypothetical protein